MEDLFKAHESANSALQVYEDMKGGSSGSGAPAYTSPAYSSPTSNAYTPASEKKSSSGPVPPPLLDLADDVSNPLLIQSMTPVVSAKGPASPRAPPSQQPSISPPRKGPPSTPVVAPPAPAPAVSLIEQDDPFKSDVTDPFGAGGSSIDTLLTPSHTDYTATTSPTTQAPSRPSANDDILALFTTPAASTTTSAPVPYQYQPSTNQHTY